MIEKNKHEYLYEVSSPQTKLEKVYERVNSTIGGIERIAVVLYDQQTDILKTYLSIDEGENPLMFYETTLKETPGLRTLMQNMSSRTIHDMTVFAKGKGVHTQKIAKKGYKSSYTFPMFRLGVFYGFIFFNSMKKNNFAEQNIEYLEMMSQLISDFVYIDLTTIKTMVAAFRSANTYVHYKDPETGEHLERMSKYSRLIAMELARKGKVNYTDRDIEYIYLFSPLHDLGKIAIPDQILRKPGPLSEDEWDIMKTHTTEGKKILLELIKTFDLKISVEIEMIFHIVELHHEMLDGSGYPHGLSGDEVPMVTRIITISDIFDALTTERPYKEAWSNDKAFATLREMAKNKLDSDCLAILEENRHEVEAIQKMHFKPGQINVM
ncbi:MAG: HD domain-containing phosphohydrolase [Leptospirales bacterium]